MENLNFALGILSTVGVFLLGYASLGVFRVKQQIVKINQHNQTTYQSLEKRDSEIANDIHNAHVSAQNQSDEIYKQMDSRFDKLENKLKK